MEVKAVDWTPALEMALVGAVLALLPLVWVLWRHRGGAIPRGARVRALTLVTLFLTFDLVLFGALTRLTDSGLGCPDWPGCYGELSPLHARDEIQAAQTALPSGPVTHGKAWVEMTHRYLATGVGALITALALLAVRARLRGDPGPPLWWAGATFVWVCLQGAFGALTVTMKLYPAIVTLHLLFGLGLLAMLAVQAEFFAPRPLALRRPLLLGVLAVVALSLLQIALGGWVSTNYAVLACQDFPTCQGAWWPTMDWAHGFSLRRELGRSAGSSGDWLPFAALTAIHMAHRLMAMVLLVALSLLAWRLAASGDAQARRFAAGLAGVAVWQLCSGLSNVVLGWPLVAAVAHTGGAAFLTILLTRLVSRALVKSAAP